MRESEEDGMESGFKSEERDPLPERRGVGKRPSGCVSVIDAHCFGTGAGRD